MKFIVGMIGLCWIAYPASDAGLWSLRPLQRPPVPAVRDTRWVRNPIDAFLLARLEREGISPSREAARETLLRRLRLDTIGLPPTLEEQDRFFQDNAPDAWERQVKASLASPHFGEKWARTWLDQARYADSDGFRGDAFRPHAWRWRHWVIDAINRNLPFDQFTIEQLAGDLLPNATVDQQVATGFLRNTLTNREGGTDPEEFRTLAVMDRVSTTGTVFLGLTLGCAQCHDHKYDPISQRDYYRFLAFFNTSGETYVDAPLAGERGPYLAAQSGFFTKRTQLLTEAGVQPLQDEWERRMIEASKNPGKWLDWDHAFDDLRTSFENGERILRTPAAQRTEKEARGLTDYFIANYNRVISKEKAKELNYDALRKKLKALEKDFPALSEAPVIREELPLRTSHMLNRGDFRSPGQAVEPGTPSVLPPLPAGAKATRLDLALWLTSRENPLTARVIVNRIWQEYFGHGLVKTSENFGTQGEQPSHPELLDWLAAEFIDSGWDTKHIHHLIVTTSAYRQSSRIRPDLLEKDPENRLLARQSRLRLPAELIRDEALAVSGLLSCEIGGRSVLADWKESAGSDRYRRGVYVQVYRNKQHAFLANFDAPAGYAPVCRRVRSTTALQALNLLNDPAFEEASRALAMRVLAQDNEFRPRLDTAFRLSLGRPPQAGEEEDLRSFLTAQQRELAKTRPNADTDLAAWSSLMSVLLNTDEFITRE